MKVLLEKKFVLPKENIELTYPDILAMLLEENGPEVSTEKDEVEEEKPRAPNSTFLPCSFKVLLFLISTLIAYGLQVESCQEEFLDDVQLS